jgi:hypothetical protein
MVDCAIFTSTTIVFVEGKRTERGASRKTSWYPTRNQVIRNLDSARALASATGLDYYVLLLVEEANANDPRIAEATTVTAPETVDASLPHLDSA